MPSLSKIFKNNNDEFKKFCRFLKEHGVYRKFFENMANCNENAVSFNNRYKHNFNRFFAEEINLYWVRSAFVWDDTKERFDFWCNMSKNWIEFNINEIQRK